MADKELQVRDDDALQEGSEPARETSKEARGGFGILKPGRGYWVRVMTAVCMGTLFLSMALWAWQQCEAYEPPAGT